MSKFVLVTGGAGYIGSHTVVALCNMGYTPVIVDDFRNAHPIVLEGLKNITGQVIEVHRIDCCNKIDLEKVFASRSWDGIIHFAAYKAVGESVEQPLKYYQNNLTSLFNVLDLMKKHSIENLVFSSSCTVYGEPKDTIEVDEQTPKQLPNSPYGYTKWICEQILEDFTKANHWARCMSLRYFNPIGAHKSARIGEFPIGKPNNLLPYITQTASGKLKNLTVFGNDYPTKDGTCIRDYIHVEDLADAHVLALDYLNTKQNKPLSVFNVGTGKGTSVLEMIQCFEKVNSVKLSWGFGKRREGDVTAIYANVNKINSLIGWSAKRTLEDSVRSAWEWENYLSSKM